MKNLINQKEYFENSREHLYAELQLIELLIKKQILITNGQNKDYYKFDEFSGMYISEEEIDSYIDENEENPFVQENINNEKIINIDRRIRKVRSQINQCIDSSLKKGINLNLIQLVKVFNLSKTEVEILLCSLAPDIDMRFERYFSYLQNDVSKKRPSVQLLSKIFFGEDRGTYQIRKLLNEDSPLTGNHLISLNTNGMNDELPLSLQQPKAPLSVINFLIEINQLDITLKGIAELESPYLMDMNAGYYFHHKNIIKKMLHHYEVHNKIPLTYISGLHGSEKKSLIDTIAHFLNQKVIRIKCSKLIGFEGDILNLLNIIEREKLLHSAIVHLANIDMIIDDNDKMKERLNIIKEYFQENGVGSIIISGTKRYEEIKDIIGLIPRQFHIPPPNIEERSELWKTYLKCTGNKDGNELLDELASKYLFTPGQIKSVIQKSFINSINKIDENMMVELNDLYKYCKEESNQRLFTYSQKIDPKYTWDDIIIPIDNLNQLKEICNCVKNRKRVYHDWGFESKISLGRGLNVLFSGPPGTGKTMSAEIIANELSLELYKIDLSRIVSKYIGETEKNLNKIFLEAETGNCILFFDEADALFGKRSEVKDSHDRYANIEISFLLQKIEEYEGIVMLATNMMKNFDSAFLRRLNYIVEFPFPNEKYRELIWNKVSGVFT